MRTLAIFTLLFLSLAGSADARPRRPPPRRFYVTGLVAPAVLNLHQKPSAASPRVGQIPPDARAVFATGRDKGRGRAAWRELEYEGVRGWAPARFLKAETNKPHTPALVSRAEVFREDLVCVGAPPYWKLVIDRDGSIAGNERSGVPEGLRAAPARADAPARNPRKPRPRGWSIAVRDARGLPFMTLGLRETGKCRDGVSPDIYGYDVAIKRADGATATGCCNRLTLAGRTPPR